MTGRSSARAEPTVVKRWPERRFKESRRDDRQQGGASLSSFSLFVDGLADGVSRETLSAIFKQAGVLRSVFVQRRKKPGRRFRFGFLRFTSNDDAERAIRKFNGMKLEGAYLLVRKAKYPWAGGGGRQFSPQLNSKHRYVVRGKFWRPKFRENDQEGRPEDVKPDACMLYATEEDDRRWVERCVVATTYNVRSVESIQEGLRMDGLNNFKVKLLGARDVVLEFESKEDMLFTLSEAASTLDMSFEWYKPSDLQSSGTSHLVWIRVWKVPLGAWNFRFFSIIGNTLGKFVCVDEITSRKDRLDY